MPRSARVRPARIEISVVLPAPFGPSRPKNSPCCDRQIDADERLHVAEAARDIDDFDSGEQVDLARARPALNRSGRRHRKRPRASAATRQAVDGQRTAFRASRRRFSAIMTASAAESARVIRAKSTTPLAGSAMPCDAPKTAAASSNVSAPSKRHAPSAVVKVPLACAPSLISARAAVRHSSPPAP